LWHNSDGLSAATENARHFHKKYDSYANKLPGIPSPPSTPPILMALLPEEPGSAGYSTFLFSLVQDWNRTFRDQQQRFSWVSDFLDSQLTVSKH